MPSKFLMNHRFSLNRIIKFEYGKKTQKSLKIGNIEVVGNASSRNGNAMTEKSGATGAWPLELRLNAEKNTLRVTFTDGTSAALSAEFLRVVSPSAEVQGHSPSERKLVAGKQSVLIRAIEPVGNYAVRLVFGDGHDTGIYSWSYLHELARNQEELWNGYLKEIADAGLSRNS
jgi:DUF971 family protein